MKKLSVAFLKEKGFRKLSISQQCMYRKHHELYIVLIQVGPMLGQFNLFVTENDPKHQQDIKSLTESLRYPIVYDDGERYADDIEDLLSLDKIGFIERLQKRILTDVVVLSRKIEFYNNNIDKLEKLKNDGNS